MWEASSRPDLSPPPSTKLPNLDPRISDPYSKWAASEALADRIRALSLRSTDDEDSEDPYAVVLFSDIRPFLVPVRSERAKDVFRRVWLAFAGLHVPGFLASLSERLTDNADDRWAYAHLATSAYLSFIFPADTSAKRITADAQAGVLVGREREYGSGFGPVKSWGYGTIDPLDNFGQGRWTMWTSEDVQGVDASLVREIFKQCRITRDAVEWDILNLAFEAAVDTKGYVTSSSLSELILTSHAVR